MFRAIGLLLLCAWLCKADPQPLPQIRWCLGTFPGFYGFNPQSRQPEGPSVLYLQELANRAHFQLLMSPETPSSRCFHMLATGDTDLVTNILKIGAGRADIHYIQFGSRWPDRAYIANNKTLLLETPTQLSTMTIVTIRNHKLTKELQQVLDGMKPGRLMQVKDAQTALQMVAKGRIDVALLGPGQVHAVLSQQAQLAAGLKEVSFSTELVKPQPIYIGLSKKCQQCEAMIPAIKQSIAAMNADGSTAKLFGDTVLTDF